MTAPAAVGTLTNHASVSAATFDPKANNNAAVAATTLLAAGTGELPHTGADGLRAIGFGFVLVLLGAGLRSIRRRPVA